MDSNWAKSIGEFWFSELKPADWWVGGAHIDRQIKDRFLGLHEQLAASVPDQAWKDPETALATIIALDQFPRNMFRKSARAFATDQAALALSKNAVAKGFDKGMSDDEKRFLYMPHVHSENLDDQNTAVALFEALDEEDSAKHAVEHRDIVERFGRFPHRNAALGRESTPEEIAFAAGHDGFGQ